MDDIQAVIGFLCNIVIKQAKKLEIGKRCKWINLDQVSKSVVGENQSVQFR